MPTDSPPCWLCASTTRPGIPSSSPVISTHDAAASFWPSRWARSSTRCKSSADIEVLAEPITPIFIGGLCMVLSSRRRGVRRICPHYCVALLGVGGTPVRRCWAIDHNFCLRPLCPQVLQQRLGLLEVGGVKPLGEPTVDRCEQLPRFGTLALLLPQATQAHGSPQLPRLGLLAARYGQGLLEACFRLGCIRNG